MSVKDESQNLMIKMHSTGLYQNDNGKKQIILSVSNKVCQMTLVNWN